MAMPARYNLDDLAINTPGTSKSAISLDVFEAFMTDSSGCYPLRFDDYEKSTIFKVPIKHGMLTGKFLSTILGNILPGDGTVKFCHDLRFKTLLDAATRLKDSSK